MVSYRGFAGGLLGVRGCVILSATSSSAMIVCIVPLEMRCAFVALLAGRFSPIVLFLASLSSLTLAML